MATERTAEVRWRGSLMEGRGTIERVESGAFGPLDVTWASRSEEPEGLTSPEELIAAAHATCYAMVVAGALGRANASAKATHVKCTISADKSEAGIKIQQSTLEVEAEGLTGMDAATFEKTAKEAEGKCPVSNALRGSLTIEVKARVK
jgi:osmotically inducible protein OsmC